ncbi:ParB/RepB/Spo0J family partition protein [Caproicibacterium argilliputei]|uniref:ParB/RepB/Spo0J family partition protein n=1 Tax=Caproicibacterium argilliputei TaxID=3030016 RepID=A0AA97H374_9FIRM|nr:ParB/RepB/Spo0J family partition protein [Caproicibacterium argilliputei]WOC32912.1 ParB/RepB/Spo0J family partition protein [Caproicibacterium argilliputei]
MKKQSLPTLEQAFSGTLFGSGATTLLSDIQIVEFEPSELTEITDQPFHAYGSDKLSQLADSIRENGQQQPCIVRKIDNKYIILAGRNRKRACELAGCKVKCIVRECTDAEADLILTDTNLYQRHELLPSELAHAYKMQKAAYEARGEKKSTAAIADTYGETIKTIQRYIKLADLNRNLLAFVDSGRIPVMAGVMLTDTTYPGNQQRLADYLINNPSQKVSLKQAEGLMKLETLHNWYSDILADFFAGKIDLLEPDEADGVEEPVPAGNQSKMVEIPEIQSAGNRAFAPVHECKAVEKHVRDSSGNLPLPNQETVFSEDDIVVNDAAAPARYERLTHERCNGIKSGYWSEATKEELVQRLAEFENIYPDGPIK